MAAVRPGKTLLVYCYGAVDFQRFVRLRPALERRGWRIVLVSHLLSIRIRCWSQGIACRLLRPRAPAVVTPDIGCTPEDIQGAVDAREVGRFRRSAWAALENASRRFGAKALAQWNGLRLGGQLATAYARQAGLATVFFELGNVEPKLFADPEGVNAASRLARHPEMLDAYQVGDEEIEAWRAAFTARKRAAAPLPQAERLRRINPWFPVDWFGALVLRIPQPLPISIGLRLKARLRLRRRKLAPDVAPQGCYIFVPLQVSDDTNLLLFSDHDNLSALRAVAARARERGLGLVVKPHPAERDPALLSAVAAACEAEGALLTSYNTTRLIEGAEEVVTINSTVGLEALILGKPVVVLGRSLYAGFSRRQASVFALRHLLDFSPFGAEEASPEVVDRIVAILEAQGA